MNKASWLPAHVYGNGYVGIGSKGICSWGRCGNPRDFAVIYYSIHPRPPLFLSLASRRIICVYYQKFNGNVNMNHNEEVPDFLGGHGDLLPADVLKMVNELLEQLHRKEKDHQGSPVFIYAPGSQYVDKQFNLGKEPHPQTPLRRAKGVDCPEETKSLPDELATDKAMVLWKKAQQAGYVDENYQPLISRTQAALLADEMAKRLGIKDKWKVFEELWNRRNMYRDYHDALEQHQSLQFRDILKVMFQ